MPRNRSQIGAATQLAARVPRILATDSAGHPAVFISVDDPKNDLDVRQVLLQDLAA